jgi:hypothetical protein
MKATSLTLGFYLATQREDELNSICAICDGRRLARRVHLFYVTNYYVKHETKAQRQECAHNVG